jgi:hypothetical protein
MSLLDYLVLPSDATATARENQQSAIAYATANYQAGRISDAQFRSEMAAANALPTTTEGIISAAQAAGIGTPSETFGQVASAQGQAIVSDLSGLDPTAFVRDIGSGLQGNLAAGVKETPTGYSVTAAPATPLRKTILTVAVAGAIIVAGLYFWNLRPSRR